MLYYGYTQNITFSPEIPLLCTLNKELQFSGTAGHTWSSQAPTNGNNHFVTGCNHIHQLTFNRFRINSLLCL